MIYLLQMSMLVMPFQHFEDASHEASVMKIASDGTAGGFGCY